MDHRGMAAACFYFSSKCLISKQFCQWVHHPGSTAITDQMSQWIILSLLNSKFQMHYGQWDFQIFNVVNHVAAGPAKPSPSFLISFLALRMSYYFPYYTSARDLSDIHTNPQSVVTKLAFLSDTVSCLKINKVIIINSFFFITSFQIPLCWTWMHVWGAPKWLSLSLAKSSCMRRADVVAGAGVGAGVGRGWAQ